MMLPDKQSKTMVSRFSVAVIEQRISIAERANSLMSTLPESWRSVDTKKVEMSKCQSDRDSLIIRHFPNEVNGKLICSHYNGGG
jgi:hypothetical protein